MLKGQIQNIPYSSCTTAASKGKIMDLFKYKRVLIGHV